MGDPSRFEEPALGPDDIGSGGPDAVEVPGPAIGVAPALGVAPTIALASAPEASPTYGPMTPVVDAVAAIAARVADGGTPDVRADDPLAEAGRKVLRFQLARMLARVPGVVSGEDAEEVHAMRVAARRMRAAWRIFGDGFEPDAERRYRRELREVGRRLGAVRDLDVLIEILVAHRDGHGSRQRAGLEPLLAAWRAQREVRRDELLGALASEPFVRFVTDYEALVLTPGHGAIELAPHEPGLVRNRVPAAIWVAYQHVWAFDDGLGTADLVALHELRIAGKWLRYALEAVREPLGPESGALVKPIVALQDHLGSQHDLHVAATLAREFAASSARPAPEARAIGRLAAQLDAGVERLGRTLGTTWRPIVAPSYRRRLGRAIARL